MKAHFIDTPQQTSCEYHGRSDRDEVMGDLRHQREYYYERLLLTEAQLTSVFGPKIKADVKKKLDQFIVMGVDEHGKYRQFYSLIDDVCDRRTSGFRRERVAWTISTEQSRKLMCLNEQMCIGQSGAVFEWSSANDAALLCDAVGVDVPLVSAVLAATKSNKTRGEKADPDDDDEDSKKIGTPTTNPLVGQKRANPDDSPLPTWDEKYKIGRFCTEASLSGPRTTPRTSSLKGSPSKQYPPVPPMSPSPSSGASPSSGLTAAAVAALSPPGATAAGGLQRSASFDVVSHAGRSDAASSAAGDSEEDFSQCPKDIPGKAEYWIGKNNLFRHLDDAKLKNSVKEARNLLDRIRGKAEFSGVFSDLSRHMSNVTAVLTATKSNILSGNVKGDQLVKALAPVMASDGTCNGLSPQYMHALTSRKVKLLLPGGVAIDQAAIQACKNVWNRCKPWSQTSVDVEDSDAAMFGDDGEGTEQATENTPTTNVSEMDLETDSFNFYPIDPMISQIPNKYVGESASMFTNLLVNQVMCSLILKDADFKESCAFFAK
eukprot:9469923-Pyramimonas_sp.AAC.1